ncbi:MAG: OmpA family protein [Gammaproteobacteria bacterium]|nr:OmpA family protein [Gammaproteobacteria bacterium]
MNRRMGVVAVLLSLGLAQSALAGDWTAPRGQWYVSPMVGINFEDKDRDSNPGVTASLGLGRQFTDSWAVELSLFGGRNSGYNEFRPVGVGLDLTLDLGAKSLLAPYLVLGTGFLRGDVVEGPIINRELNYDSVIGTAGIGFIAPLGNAATRLRSEVRYRTDFKSPQFSDLLVLVGFYRPLGESAPRPDKTTREADEDRDGVNDDIDLCPGTPRRIVVDVFGCERDSDGDGVDNIKDDCPGTPPETPVSRRGCGLAPDSDHDGVADSKDRCPGTPQAAAVDAAGCEVDGDGDGVINGLDYCQNTPAGARVDVRGCEIGGTISLPGVRFKLNSADLISTSTAKLDDAAATLRANPGLVVEAAGYTDTSGSPSLNLDLSQRRAESVRRYLISRDVNADNIRAAGYGQANPIADNSTRTGRQQNRRVELRLLN